MGTGRSQSARERVRRFLKLFESNANVLVLISPDPDSIASAFALKRLLWKRVYRIQIAYTGLIQRLDNLAMKQLLKIPMSKVDQVAMEGFTHRILVDSQPHHSEFFLNLTYDAIIDHHPMDRKWDAAYVDIRPEYGANATILTEYLRGAGIKPSMKLSTALLYGIKTDTSNFERSCTEEDIRQFQYLFKYANMSILLKIEKSELRMDELVYFEKALENRIVTNKGIYSHLGRVSNPDICVQVADFFTKVHGVGWIFVSGVHDSKIIIIFRNDGSRKDAGRLASRTFGTLGSAGGHAGAARAEIPLDVLRQKGIRGYGADIEAFIRRCLNF